MHVHIYIHIIIYIYISCMQNARFSSVQHSHRLSKEISMRSFLCVNHSLHCYMTHRTIHSLLHSISSGTENEAYGQYPWWRYVSIGFTCQAPSGEQPISADCTDFPAKVINLMLTMLEVNKKSLPEGDFRIVP